MNIPRVSKDRKNLSKFSHVISNFFDNNLSINNQSSATFAEIYSAYYNFSMANDLVVLSKKSLSMLFREKYLEEIEGGMIIIVNRRGIVFRGVKLNHGT